MPIVKLTSMTSFVLLAWLALFGNYRTPITEVPDFHVHGTIRISQDFPDPGAKVTFVSQNFTRTVSANKNGFYQVDLPVGLYTMTVVPSEQYFQEYRRPLFRAMSPIDLDLDVMLDPQVSCDVGTRPGAPAPTQDDFLNICGGVDLFSVPSADTTPFQLSIRYRNRHPADTGYVYNSGKVVSGTPVLVAYNLFTLKADHVLYNIEGRTLTATGNVAVEQADGGAPQRADSMTLKIENGQATRQP